MTMKDDLGLIYTARHSASEEQFNRALTCYLASETNTMAILDELLANDPDMPMATIFKACLMKLAADPRLDKAIQRTFQNVSRQKDLNDREVMHCEALGFWSTNQMDKASNTYDQLIQNYPKDMLALRVAHYLHFYGKGGEAMVKSLAPAISTWEPEDPFYGYLQGMTSFALEELGDYREAERSGYKALNINGSDIWAAHAVIHVMQMQGRFQEGIKTIESLQENWGNVNNFVNHLYWHKALLLIGLDEPKEALNIYDRLLVKPLKDDFYLDVCNAASLLWRLVMLNIDVEDRWQQLNEISTTRINDDELAFSTLHYLMAPAALGDEAAIQRCLDNFKTWSTRHGTQALVCRNVGLQLAEIICQLQQGDSEAAVAQLCKVQPQISQIGGSHAQRHLFEQIIEFYG